MFIINEEKLIIKVDDLLQSFRLAYKKKNCKEKKIVEVLVF